ASLEHPRLWGGLLDLDGTSAASTPSEADALLREVLHGDGEDQVALRGDRRFAVRLVRAAPLADTADGGRFDPGGLYLITGGFGALGVKLAEWLAGRHGVKHIALLSRRGDSDPAAGSVRGALEKLGAPPIILKGDITSEHDVRRVIAQLGESKVPIKGIFHCAGLLDDGILMQ